MTSDKTTGPEGIVSKWLRVKELQVLPIFIIIYSANEGLQKSCICHFFTKTDNIYSNAILVTVICTSGFRADLLISAIRRSEFRKAA